jgi:hypothetical protein
MGDISKSDTFRLNFSVATFGRVFLGMVARDDSEASAGPSTWRLQIYSIRRPDIARLITSRWISEVPSKIV